MAETFQNMANQIEWYNFFQLPCSNQTQRNVCQILVQTALEELYMARNLAPMTPLSTQIYVVNLIIVPKIVFYY